MRGSAPAHISLSLGGRLLGKRKSVKRRIQRTLAGARPSQAERLLMRRTPSAEAKARRRFAPPSYRLCFTQAIAPCPFAFGLRGTAPRSDARSASLGTRKPQALCVVLNSLAQCKRNACSGSCRHRASGKVNRLGAGRVAARRRTRRYRASAHCARHRASGDKTARNEARKKKGSAGRADGKTNRPWLRCWLTPAVQPIGGGIIIG